MKKVIAKRAASSHRASSAKLRKKKWHQLFSFRLSILGVLLLGCLTVVLGALYNFLPKQSGVLGISASALLQTASSTKAQINSFASSTNTAGDITQAVKDHFKAQLLLADNYSQFMQNAVSGSVKSHIAPALQGYIEDTDVTVQGTVKQIHEDNFTNDTVNYRNVLLGNDGKEYLLHITGNKNGLTAGSKVTISHAARLGENITTNASTITTSRSTATNAQPAGEMTAAVVLINFKGDPTNKPFTKEEIKQRVFGRSGYSVNTFLHETSYNSSQPQKEVQLIGKQDPSGDVFSWVTVDEGGIGVNCDYAGWWESGTGGWIKAANDGVRARDHVDLSTYKYVIYASVYDDKCPFGGVYVDDRSIVVINPESGDSKTWVNEVTHELGH